jgi:hypothetical protein
MVQGSSVEEIMAAMGMVEVEEKVIEATDNDHLRTILMRSGELGFDGLYKAVMSVIGDVFDDTAETPVIEESGFIVSTDMKKSELRTMASERGIYYNKKTKKQELVDKIIAYEDYYSDETPYGEQSRVEQVAPTPPMEHPQRWAYDAEKALVDLIERYALRVVDEGRTWVVLHAKTPLSVLDEQNLYQVAHNYRSSTEKQNGEYYMITRYEN